MTKVIKSELESSKKLLDDLNSYRTTLTGVRQAITSFINNSPYASGKGYEAAKNRLSMYVDAVTKQQELSLILTDNINAANDAMIAFMEEFDELDNATLAEQKAQLNKIKALILKAYEVMYATKLVAHYDNWDTKHQYPYYTREFLYSYEDRRNYQRALECEGGWLDQKKKLEKLIAKLENLDAADNAAYSAIEGVSVDVDNFEKAINNIDRSVFVS